MVDEPVFAHLSFSQLTDTAKAAVMKCAQKYQSDSFNSPEWPIDIQTVFSERFSLPQALARSKSWVSRLDPVMFPICSSEKAEYYEEELSFAFYLAIADCELAILEGRADVARRQEHVLHVANVLAQLRNRAHINQPMLPAHDRDEPDHYFGLYILAPKITEAIEAWTTPDKVVGYVDYPGSLNGGRFYLIWATQLLNALCLAINRTRHYLSFGLASNVLNGLSDATGSMGWGLYFLRFGVNARFALDVPKQMDALNLSKSETSDYQIEKALNNKFLLANDLVWGLVNFVCFWILVGDGLLGWYGNILTAGLFMFDFSLCMLEFSEAQAKHEAEMLDYQRAIDALKQKLLAGEIMDVSWRLQALEKAQARAALSWRYDLKQLQLNAMYVASVIVGFILMASFLTPPGALIPVTALMLALIGSSLCFAFTLAHKSTQSWFDILESGEVLDGMEAEYQVCIDLFKASDSSDDKRQLFLDMRLLWAEAEEQKQLVLYQQADMWCTLMTRMALPALFLAGFVFMPMTLGVSMFVVGAILLLAANCYVAEFAPESEHEKNIPLSVLSKFSKLFKPAPDAQSSSAELLQLPPPFPEGEYLRFTEGVENDYTHEELKAHVSPTFSAETVEESGEVARQIKK
ncbi:MAG: hypothetical protein K0U24_08490 [Gammaproteobacteria bacterium]|nr:hypothetical protein [Gammaproteobacteria bacterium]